MEEIVNMGKEEKGDGVEMAHKEEERVEWCCQDLKVMERTVKTVKRNKHE